ncbi:hypothetical protein GPK69_03620 [Roseburia inulinivorans]|uniref:hypothetical protein n=1 Tax=Roseburia inulinivorans TaxID=360807 RepID=UPI001C01A3D1|nr:hypothetical protein [Roseburia inulinivorans]MBT9644926.1 hypothetical protein [Roseburia inulinivorans]
MKGSQDNAKFIRRYVGIVLKKLFASRTTALIVNSCLGFCFFDTQGRKDGIICVFNKPDDYPDKYVARLFEGTAPTNIIITRNTVEEIREDITRRFPAMLPFARNKEDHKSVVESWI